MQQELMAPGRPASAKLRGGHVKLSPPFGPLRSYTRPARGFHGKMPCLVNGIGNQPAMMGDKFCSNTTTLLSPKVSPPVPRSSAIPTLSEHRRLQSAFHSIALFVLVTATLFWGHAVFVPLALATLFAFILSNPAEWLEEKGLGRAWSVLLVTLGAFVIVGGVVTVATLQLRNLATQLPTYEKNISAKMTPIYARLDQLEALEKKLEQAKPEEIEGNPEDKPREVMLQPPGTGSLHWLPTLAQPIVEMLVHGVMVIVLTVFMLLQREMFRDKFLRLAGRRRLTGTTRALSDAANRVGKYLLLQLATNACLGVLITIGLYLIGVPYAPLWGMLVTVLRFVPYVGFWIAGLAAAAMSAAAGQGWTAPLLVLGMFLLFDLILANVIEPLLFSHGTGVSAVALLISAVFWAWLWGPVGLLLSTPLTVCLAVFGTHIPGLTFLAVLLGDEQALDQSARFYNRLLARDYDEATILLTEFAKDHSREEVYDQVILPALAQAKTDREQQDITIDEEQSVFDSTGSLVQSLIDRATPEDGGAAAANDLPPVKVIGCAVFGEADTLALNMLADAIQPAGGELIVTDPPQLPEAVKNHATPDKPTVICLATLSPGGLSQASALISRTRRKFPQTKILVGRWGQQGDTTQTNKFLCDAGASNVGWTLHETIEQLVPGHSEEKPTPKNDATATAASATTAAASDAPTSDASTSDASTSDASTGGGPANVTDLTGKSPASQKAQSGKSRRR